MKILISRKIDIREVEKNIKKIIPNINLTLNKETIEVSGFKKGVIYDYIPRIKAIPGVKKIDLEINEIMPLISEKNFHFNKPFKTKEKFIIAGPCVINDFNEFRETLIELINLGIKTVRTPLFKPRTSPYTWEGFGLKGVKNLREIKNEFDFISVMEILDVRVIEKVFDVCDIIQIGARNMRNYILLKETAKTKRPILLKRHPHSSLREFLFSAEYLAKYGATKIILCERGDSFSDGDSSLNIDILKRIKEDFKIPIIVDLSHAAKNTRRIFYFAKKIKQIPHGFMVEVSKNPSSSPTDTNQILNIEGLKKLLEIIK